MNSAAIWVTLASSVLSGLIGVFVSAWFFYRLERRRQKQDLARKLLGSRFSIRGDEFSCAMNEVIGVFANSDDVLKKMRLLYEALETPGKKNAEPALIDFLKSVCKHSGLSQVVLNDTYLLKTFNARD